MVIEYFKEKLTCAIEKSWQTNRDIPHEQEHRPNEWPSAVVPRKKWTRLEPTAKVNDYGTYYPAHHKEGEAHHIHDDDGDDDRYISNKQDYQSNSDQPTEHMRYSRPQVNLHQTSFVKVKTDNFKGKKLNNPETDSYGLKEDGGIHAEVLRSPGRHSHLNENSSKNVKKENKLNQGNFFA